jgi:hypothetical protein
MAPNAFKCHQFHIIASDSVVKKTHLKMKEIFLRRECVASTDQWLAVGKTLLEM